MLRIGTVGTSAIMRVIQDGIRQTEGLTGAAVYSRDAARARAFADSVGVPQAYASYDDLTAREGIDLIYIASPNALHYDQALQALRHGKHVIVEKPLAVTRQEAEALTLAARQQGVYLFEAITTLFMPNYLRYRALLPSLGKIHHADIRYAKVSSQYAAYLRGDNPNIFNPAMGGGALNDMGVYGVHAAVDLFGVPEDVHYEAAYGENGVDLSGVLTLRYPGFACQVTAAKNADLGSGCRIEGENGWLLENGAINDFATCSAEINGVRHTLDDDHSANRMVYELARFRDAITQRDDAFFDRMCRQSVAVATILEQARGCALNA